MSALHKGGLQDVFPAIMDPDSGLPLKDLLAESIIFQAGTSPASPAQAVRQGCPNRVGSFYVVEVLGRGVSEGTACVISINRYVYRSMIATLVDQKRFAIWNVMGDGGHKNILRSKSESQQKKVC